MPLSKRPSWQLGADDVTEELNSMAGSHGMAGSEHRSTKSRVRELSQKSPEKRPRSASPTPSTSVLDFKTEKSKLFF